MKKKVAVIGSGIAGLTIANLLKRNSDFEVIVYEKEDTLSLKEGYGIQLSTNSISILNKIGFKNIDNNNIFNPLKLNFYSINNKICNLNLNRFNTDSVKYTTLKRFTLIEFLKNELFTNNLRFGKEVKKVSKIKGKLLINFTDNTNDLVDFIIVSDGVFSKTKSIIENKIIKPHYNGSVAIRTVVKSSEDFNYDNNNISLIMLQNAHVALYPINKKNEFNLVCIVRQKLSQNNDIRSIIRTKILSQNNSLENLFKGDLDLWPIYVSKKITRSTYDNVFYLGDAFYTFTPTMAQGASQSIEGAYELFNLLSKNTKEIQDLYFRQRLKRTNLINRRSKLNYFSFHLSSQPMILMRNLILKNIIKSDKFLNRYLGNIYQEI